MTARPLSEAAELALAAAIGAAIATREADGSSEPWWIERGYDLTDPDPRTDPRGPSHV